MRRSATAHKVRANALEDRRHCCCRAVCVTGLDVVADRPVDRPREGGEIVGRAWLEHPEAVRLEDEVADEARHAGAAGDLADLRVKLHRGENLLTRRRCRAIGLHQPPDRRHLVGQAPSRGVCRDPGLEQKPQGCHFRDVVEADGAHDVPFAGEHEDEPVVGEEPQRLSHRGLGDAEPLGERRLRDRIAGAESDVEDVVAQRLVDALGERDAFQGVRKTRCLEIGHAPCTRELLWICHRAIIAEIAKIMPLMYHCDPVSGAPRERRMTTRGARLAEHVEHASLVDTHEHLASEQEWIQSGGDVIHALFGNYVRADLAVAGASQASLDGLFDPATGSAGERFAKVSDAWDACRHTGYGEAVRLTAELIFGLEELEPDALDEAQRLARDLARPGERARLLREVARIEHVQVDPVGRRTPRWACEPDATDPSLVLYDISWWSFCMGEIDVEAIHDDCGVGVENLDSLAEAITAIFARHAPLAIAVKSQHAYGRTLHWEERSDADAARSLQASLRGAANEADRLCLGDWCLARAVEHGIEHDLPVKLHTGYYAGAGTPMPVSRIRPGNLWALLARYPDARFVLMHIAYPYDRELVALAKHHANVWVDLCWAWSLDPYTAVDFVRRFLHSVPISKLFAFGGDEQWPTSVVGYAAQARRWLARALEAEVDAGDLSEQAAIRVADRLLSENQHGCFDIAGRRSALARHPESTP